MKWRREGEERERTRGKTTARSACFAEKDPAHSLSDSPLRRCPAKYKLSQSGEERQRAGGETHLETQTRARKAEGRHALRGSPRRLGAEPVARRTSVWRRERAGEEERDALGNADLAAEVGAQGRRHREEGRDEGARHDPPPLLGADAVADAAERGAEEEREERREGLLVGLVERPVARREEARDGEAELDEAAGCRVHTKERQESALVRQRGGKGGRREARGDALWKPAHR